MRRRAAFVILGLLVAAALALAFRARHPTTPSVPAAAEPIAIEDGKTIDFSSGRPVVSQTPADQAAMEAVLREMEAAAAEVTFEPTTPPAAEAGETP